MLIVTQVDVMIVGAGPAGLGCAVELRRAGLNAVVLEQAENVGASWRSHYDRLRLNTSRWFSQLPSAPYPPGTPMFPSRTDFIGYLERYARQHAVEVRARTHVSRISPEGGGWVLETSQGNFRVPNVVVATGMAHSPAPLPWPRREEYRGKVLHSSQYKSPGPFAGKSVLVVGAGASGMEIAEDLADAGAHPVRLSVRTPPNLLLRSVGGLPGDPIAMLLLRFPPRLADAVLAKVRRATLGDLSQYGLPIPKEGPFERLHRDGAAPAVVDREVVDAIRAGRIEVVAGIESFWERGAQLSDGSRLEVDAVVAATGYRCGLETMVGHLGVLDVRGFPNEPTGDEAAPGLCFIAFRPLPGLLGDIGRQARRVAKAILTRRSARAPDATNHARRDEE